MTLSDAPPPDRPQTSSFATTKRGIAVALLLGFGGPVLGGAMLFLVVVGGLGIQVLFQSPTAIFSLEPGVVLSAFGQFAEWLWIFCAVALYTGGVAAAISAVLLGISVARHGTFTAVGAIVAALVGSTAEVALLLVARAARQPLRLSDITYLGLLLWVLPPICALIGRNLLIRSRLIAAYTPPPSHGLPKS